MSASPASSQTTAGLLNGDWNPRNVPAGTITTNVVLRSADNAATSGSLYGPAKPSDTVVCVMHPREFMACHYLIPDIVAAGFAAWSQAPGSVGNDLRLEHEFALHDVAAGLAHLKSRGFKRIVLLGNSGGAGLYAFYAQQAALPGARRIAKTPGGKATQLAELDMPAVDGSVLVGPHPGQGALLLNCIDPSVADEDDALSVDSALDALNPANGYAGTKGTRYEAAFVERYRAAQRARVARIDAKARSLIEQRLAARRRVKEARVAASVEDKCIAAHTPILNVWRTDGDLRCFDLSLNPSDRTFGSLWGADSYASNYGGRRLRPPGHAAPLAVHLVGPVVERQPGQDRLGAGAAGVLVVEYTGDQACLPSDVRGIVDSIASKRKAHHRTTTAAPRRTPSPPDADRPPACWPTGCTRPSPPDSQRSCPCPRTFKRR